MIRLALFYLLAVTAGCQHTKSEHKCCLQQSNLKTQGFAVVVGDDDASVTVPIPPKGLSLRDAVAPLQPIDDEVNKNKKYKYTASFLRGDTHYVIHLPLILDDAAGLISVHNGDVIRVGPLDKKLLAGKSTAAINNNFLALWQQSFVDNGVMVINRSTEIGSIEFVLMGPSFVQSSGTTTAEARDIQKALADNFDKGLLRGEVNDEFAIMETTQVPLVLNGIVEATTRKKLMQMMSPRINRPATPNRWLGLVNQ